MKCNRNEFQYSQWCHPCYQAITTTTTTAMCVFVCFLFVCVVYSALLCVVWCSKWLQQQTPHCLLISSLQLSLSPSLLLACSLLWVVVVIAVNLLLHFVGKVISVVVAAALNSACQTVCPAQNQFTVKNTAIPIRSRQVTLFPLSLSFPFLCFSFCMHKKNSTTSSSWRKSSLFALSSAPALATGSWVGKGEREWEKERWEGNLVLTLQLKLLEIPMNTHTHTYLEQAGRQILSVSVSVCVFSWCAFIYLLFTYSRPRCRQFRFCSIEKFLEMNFAFRLKFVKFTVKTSALHFASLFIPSTYCEFV